MNIVIIQYSYFFTIFTQFHLYKNCDDCTIIFQIVLPSYPFVNFLLTKRQLFMVHYLIFYGIFSKSSFNDFLISNCNYRYFRKLCRDEALFLQNTSKIRNLFSLLALITYLVKTKFHNTKVMLFCATNFILLPWEASTVLTLV